MEVSLFKRSKPSGEVMRIATPTDAIADLIGKLTYTEMVNMAERIKTLADENPTATMAHILNTWSRERRGHPVTASSIVAATIAADKIGPASITADRVAVEDKPLRPAPPPPTIPANRDPVEGLPASAT